jgi:hypothetical protein
LCAYCAPSNVIDITRVVDITSMRELRLDDPETVDREDP